jgi:hypothetical protein
MTHPESRSSGSFESNEEMAEALQAAALQRDSDSESLSTSTVPATPGAASPNLISLITGPSISNSLNRQGSVPSHSNVIEGTPLALGAFKVQNSLSHIASFATPLMPRTHRPSKLSASFTLSSLLMPSQ